MRRLARHIGWRFNWSRFGRLLVLLGRLFDFGLCLWLPYDVALVVFGDGTALGGEGRVEFEKGPRAQMARKEIEAGGSAGGSGGSGGS